MHFDLFQATELPVFLAFVEEFSKSGRPKARHRRGYKRALRIRTSSINEKGIEAG